MTRIERLRLSLTGLSVGDALGEALFDLEYELLAALELETVPPGPWPYTDDTEMALSIAEVLARDGAIEPGRLAAAFARRFDPARGYGGGAFALLLSLRAGAEWRAAAGAMFGGAGSFGNGAAMRVAPLGAWFADDLRAARENAVRSAAPTHAHPEGVAGAVAVALAAALAARVGEGERLQAPQWFEQIVGQVPAGETRSGLERAARISLSAPPEHAAEVLGSGHRVSAQDTVPFSLWCAARHLECYEEAVWAAASGLGDMDTTCAIVGGIVALSAGGEAIPAAWLAAREPLPKDITRLLWPEDDERKRER